MERLALGAACTPLPDSNILAPKCNDPEYYSPAFWPEKLTRKGRRASSSFSSPAGNGGSWSQGDHGANNRSRVATEASPRLRGRGKGGGIGNGDDFRVIVVTDDPAVEALLTKYNVRVVSVEGIVFVLSFAFGNLCIYVRVGVLLMVMVLMLTPSWFGR